MPAEYGEPPTERELEITELVAEGLTNREIAARLHLSPNTVKVHLRNVFTKAGVSSRTELTVLAMQERWIEVPGVPAPPEAEAEAPTEAEDTDATPEATPWPQHRWAALAMGLGLALAIFLLPQFPRGQAASGPGVDFAPGTVSPEAPLPAAEDDWVELAPLPVRRGAMGTVALEDHLYVVGGMTEEGPTGRMDVYDIEADRWASAAPRPLALANVGAAVVDGDLFVPGGCDAAWTPSAATHWYDPETDAWTPGTPLPQPVCAYGLTAYEGRVYLFGGWNGDGYQALAFVYDPAEGAWRKLPASAQARGFGAAAVLSDRIFYVGGYDGKRERATCEVYLPEANRWDPCPSMLQPRGGLGLAAAGPHLYAIGGGWTNYLGFNERYDPATGRWQESQTPIVGTWRNLGVTASATDLYIVGGLGNEYFLNRVYTVEVLPVKLYIPITFLSP
jgi:DNA-binding CsgD family transcriptional regulator